MKDESISLASDSDSTKISSAVIVFGEFPIKSTNYEYFIGGES